MRKKFWFLFVAIIFITPNIIAQGGMWLPMLLGNRQEDMYNQGCKLSAEDIYSANKSSIKDAVMLFGTGCTGEFVSENGLVFTNHHCGYYQIVSHSTVEHDYLTNGFAALNMQNELPCPGLTVTLLQYMKDVTTEILSNIDNSLSQSAKSLQIQKNIQTLINKTNNNNNLLVQIKPIYYGNQYIMYVSKVYKDVRLVAAPPSNIGKFGGDTDNWMWPRHTGDFSVFRVYADKNNEPKEYSKDNVPYQPKKFLSISLKDKQEGDFTFVMGYPGTTQQFLVSYAVEDIVKLEDPARIKIRSAILDIYNDQMRQSAQKRLHYASKVASIANGWKKWQGEIKGLISLKAVEKKRLSEQNNPFVEKEFKPIYEQLRPYKMEQIYLTEAFFASDFNKRARQILQLIDLCNSETATQEDIRNRAEKILKQMQDYYNTDYLTENAVDSSVFVNTMNIFYNDFAKDYYEFLRNKINNASSVEDYFAGIFNNSILNNPKKLNKLLSNFTRKDVKYLTKDPSIELISPIWKHYVGEAVNHIRNLNNNLDSLYAIHVKNILKNRDSKDIYPDANLTLRVTYGHISSFYPRNGVEYNYYTTIRGIMEKEDPNIYDYVVEDKLKDIYYNKDYFPYGDRVAFIATNHTTGGNSGSPVMDKDGNLIGLNFDRNWEGTMSDILYDKDLCRNITLDIRYCLLIIDKYLGAKNIIQELHIVK